MEYVDNLRICTFCLVLFWLHSICHHPTCVRQCLSKNNSDKKMPQEFNVLPFLLLAPNVILFILYFKMKHVFIKKICVEIYNCIFLRVHSSSLKYQGLHIHIQFNFLAFIIPNFYVSVRLVLILRLGIRLR